MEKEEEQKIKAK